MSSKPSKRTNAPKWASRPASSGQCKNIVNGPCKAPRLATIESTIARSFSATWSLLVISGSLAIVNPPGRHRPTEPESAFSASAPQARETVSRTRGPSMLSRFPICGRRREGPVSGVLDGIRVLDFGRYIAGPFCAALLADLGAEVIRIERIGGGEDRGFIPVGAGPDGGGAMFLAMNRNKLGMTLDPAASKGREIVKKLVATE